jgi:hypothetical protein
MITNYDSEANEYLSLNCINIIHVEANNRK